MFITIFFGCELKIYTQNYTQKLKYPNIIYDFIFFLNIIKRFVSEVFRCYLIVDDIIGERAVLSAKRENVF